MQELRQNIKPMLDSQDAPYLARAMGCFFVDNFEDIYRVITASQIIKVGHSA